MASRKNPPSLNSEKKISTYELVERVLAEVERMKSEYVLERAAAVLASMEIERIRRRRQ
jgi:hypothetical protein